jgi:hypothetical protein
MSAPSPPPLYGAGACGPPLPPPYAWGPTVELSPAPHVDCIDFGAATHSPPSRSKYHARGHLHYSRAGKGSQRGPVVFMVPDMVVDSVTHHNEQRMVRLRGSQRIVDEVGRLDASNEIATRRYWTGVRYTTPIVLGRNVQTIATNATVLVEAEAPTRFAKGSAEMDLRVGVRVVAICRDGGIHRDKSESGGVVHIDRIYVLRSD